MRSNIKLLFWFAVIQILKEKHYINYEIMLNYAKAKRKKLKEWSEITNL